MVLAVSDAEILEAKAVIDASGVGCEPASAASVAGVRRLVSDGTIAPGERVVAVLTGHVLKDPGNAAAVSPGDGTAAGEGQPTRRDRAGLREVARVLGKGERA